MDAGELVAGTGLSASATRRIASLSSKLATEGN